MYNLPLCDTLAPRWACQRQAHRGARVSQSARRLDTSSWRLTSIGFVVRRIIINDSSVTLDVVLCLLARRLAALPGAGPRSSARRRRISIARRYHVKYGARAMQWLSAMQGSLSNTGCQLRSASERERDDECRSQLSARPPANQVPLIQILGSFDP